MTPGDVRAALIPLIEWITPGSIMKKRTVAACGVSIVSGSSFWPERIATAASSRSTPVAWRTRSTMRSPPLRVYARTAAIDPEELDADPAAPGAHSDDIGRP